MKRLLVLTTAVLTLALAPPASAGEYQVKACFADPRLGPAHNASWGPDTPFTPYVATYSACPGEGIVTRMSGGPGTAPYGASARQTFTAPPGTRVKRVSGKINVRSDYGWYAGFVDSTPRWIWCGANCSSWGQTVDFSFEANSPQIFAQVTCGSGSGCTRSAQYGIVAMQDVQVTVGDDTPPGVSITGGTVTSPGWQRGDQSVQFSASDATGIQAIEAFVGGAKQLSLGNNCDWAQPRPCQDETRVASIPSSAFATDGEHRVIVKVADAAGNWSEAARMVRVDQTPPGQAFDVRLDGGEGWRAANAFTLGWRNPPQTASPISAVRYTICPAPGSSGTASRCSEGVARGRDLTALREIRVPAPGAWLLTMWLEDEAGNSDRERAVMAGVLRFDDVPPEAHFASQSSDDPTRVRVVATDTTSGVASVSIEARRGGEDAWRSLATSADGGSFSATLDDSALPKGSYELRARALDHAGNERTTQLESDGQPSVRTLPLRIATRLAVGRPTRVAARGANGRRRYRIELRARPRARYGRTIPLRGRLTMPGANPLAGADIEVWERVKLPTATWRRVSVLRTSRTGRFRFKALRGPSRTLRFRYPGTATIRSGSTEVELGVRAVTSFRASRTSVVNGEEVRFHGRLRGRQPGQTGKLLHLQVYTRGTWSTFATPRANRATGRWSEPYRFSATRGLVRYRFRVLIPREASYPYETGRSRSVAVTVRGL